MDRKKDLHKGFIDLEKAYDRYLEIFSGVAWKRKTHLFLIFKLLKICIRRQGQGLGCKG